MVILWVFIASFLFLTIIHRVIYTSNVYQYNIKTIGFSKQKKKTTAINVCKLIWLIALSVYLVTSNQLNIVYLQAPVKEYTFFNVLLLIVLGFFLLMYMITIAFTTFSKEEKMNINIKIKSENERLQILEFLSLDENILWKELSLNKIIIGFNSFINYVSSIVFIILMAYLLDLTEVSFVSVVFVYVMVIFVFILTGSIKNIFGVIESAIVLLIVFAFQTISVLLIISLIKFVMTNNFYHTSMSALIYNKDKIYDKLSE